MIGPARVVIAEDSVLLREGLVRLVAEWGGEVVAAVGDGPSILPAIEEHRPDVLLADVRMPPTHTDEGLAAALQVRQHFPEVAVLVLSQYVEHQQASRLLAQGGGVGYLLKDRVASLDELSDALDRILAGGTVLDPEVVSVLFARRNRRDRLDALTPRERDVLAAMAQGRSNSGIARELFITEKVVEKHIATILAKLVLAPSADDNRRTLAVLAWLEHDERDG